jgi:hypothetical protein
MKPETAQRYARELATYERHRAALERRHRGRIALLHGDELLGAFPNLDKALRAVLKRFGGPQQCLKQEIGKPPDLKPLFGASEDEELPPTPPPFEVYFAQELATYERRRAELERDHWDEYALIHGDEIVGVFKDEYEAIKEGHRRFGYGKFMLQDISDRILDFPNCVLPNEESD